MYFKCLDNKFSDMIVRDITPELFEKLKDESEFLTTFSFIRKSEINSKYFEKHFFKAEFLTWETNEFNPYCRLFEDSLFKDLGPLYEEANYRKIIMLN